MRDSRRLCPGSLTRLWPRQSRGPTERSLEMLGKMRVDGQVGPTDFGGPAAVGEATAGDGDGNGSRGLHPPSVVFVDAGSRGGLAHLHDWIDGVGTRRILRYLQASHARGMIYVPESIPVEQLLFEKTDHIAKLWDFVLELDVSGVSSHGRCCG